ncbi:hypothetical protein DXX93_09595 [Thalassotalea euphylliae]|uniref:Uncharacterized protein n=1 Tax=Thalassotalea euphylliae TaxID=1655234 RepID=A0A3E0TS49_9GAMM|nr:hypothetical protein [Thalassotalea euphylliae]REL26802.1 hypothetical protein DXX93_09595 [Thalassotalea euphylliae]
MTKPYSTDSIVDLHFRQHGIVDLEIPAERIVVYHARGPFNKELAQALAQVERQVCPTFKSKWGYWADLCIFSQSCLVLEEAIESYQDDLKSFKDEGISPIASAFIYPPDVEGRGVAENIYQRLYQFADISYAGFSDFNEGLAWVKDELANWPKTQR